NDESFALRRADPVPQGVHRLIGAWRLMRAGLAASDRDEVPISGSDSRGGTPATTDPTLPDVPAIPSGSADADSADPSIASSTAGGRTKSVGGLCQSFAPKAAAATKTIMTASPAQRAVWYERDTWFTPRPDGCRGAAKRTSRCESPEIIGNPRDKSLPSSGNRIVTRARRGKGFHRK